MFGLLVQCVQWEDRAAGICGTLHTVTAQNKEEVSDTACLRGPGGETPQPAEPHGHCTWLSPTARFDGLVGWRLGLLPEASESWGPDIPSFHLREAKLSPDVCSSTMHSLFSSSLHPVKPILTRALPVLNSVLMQLSRFFV
ncbi:hypothetical protein T484DRAFT_2281169 [Baffinella frigidus]|nr:hypothetical protein T484DRAFT_2281169 [Cryptophyta sp. CCMP2293]